MANKTAKVVVIGAGGIANSVHLPSLVEIEQANLAAICDLRPEKAEADRGGDVPGGSRADIDPDSGLCRTDGRKHLPARSGEHAGDGGGIHPQQQG